MATPKYVTTVPQGYVQLDRVAQAAVLNANGVADYNETAAYVRASPPLIARHAERALKQATARGITIDPDNLLYTIEQDLWDNCIVTMFGRPP